MHQLQLPNVPGGPYDNSTLSSIADDSAKPDQDPALFVAPSGAKFTVERSKDENQIKEDLICVKCSKVMTGRSFENAEGSKKTSIYQIQPDGDHDDAGDRVHLECRDSGREHLPDYHAFRAAVSISVKCANEKEGEKCNKVLPLNEIEEHWEDNCCFEKAGENLHEKFRQIENQRQDISRMNGRLNNLEEKQANTDEIIRQNAESAIKLRADLTKYNEEIEGIRMILDKKGCDNKEDADIRKKLEILQRLTAKCFDDDKSNEVKLSALAHNCEGQKKDIEDLKKSFSVLDSKYAQAGSPGPGMALTGPHRHISMQLAVINLRCTHLETASYDGTLVWKIRDLASRKRDADCGKIISLLSPPFYTSRFGYQMCGRIYLNGDGNGKGTHCSLFVVIMKGEYDRLLNWPFKQRITMMIMDQKTGKSTLSESVRPSDEPSSFTRPTDVQNTGCGCPLFALQEVLHDSKYVIDDTLFIKFIVDTSDLIH